MALPGLRSTEDFAVDERPRNWREGILINKIRNGCPLFSLTAAMRSSSTDDPEFKWWEELQRDYSYRATAAVAVAGTTIPVPSGAKELTVGGLLSNADLTEIMEIVNIPSDTSVTVIRGVAGTTPAAIPAGAVLVYMGSAFREGADSPQGSSFNPVSQRNYTQIFRDPVEWTRTAQNTNLRSSNKGTEAEDKRRAMHKHSMGIERALWIGKMYETMEAGQPKRFTGGVLERIPTANVITAATAGVKLSHIEDWMVRFFTYGSKEKLAFASLNTLTLLNRAVRLSTDYNWGPSEKMYNMEVKKFYTPAGTLCFTEMPLFGLQGGFLAQDLIVMDTANLKWRYMTGADTQYLPDREARGTDGKKSEWLTEGGLEIHHANTFHRVKNITAAVAE